MQASADLTTRLILGLSALMTVMIGFVIYTVVATHEDPWASAPVRGDGDAGPVDGAIACDASDLDKMTCPPGFYCHFDTCQPVQLEPVCDDGESCKSCECKEGSVCHRNRCVDAAHVDRTPLECEKNEKLAAAVKTLVMKCSQRSKGVDDIVSAGSCSSADWEQLALADETFDLLLAAFPDRFAVLFPAGKPHLKKQTWPSPTVRDHLIAQIRQFRGSLENAKQVFVIGRSNPDGSTEETNRLFALRRIRLVSDLIDVVAFEALSETEKSKKRVKFRQFALSSKNPIQPARFKEIYLGESKGSPVLAPKRLILEDEASHTKLVAALEGGVDLANHETPEWQKLFGELNRVVLVIPIPCDGDEYQAPKTILTPRAAKEE